MSNIDKDYLKRLNYIIEKTKGYENVAFPVGTNGEFGALYISDLENVLSTLKREKATVKFLSKLNKEIFDELETYKKIAEKLESMCESYGLDVDIDWARNEVENE